LKQARAFYTLILLSTGVGVGLDFAGINPVKALYWTAVINSLFAPFLRNPSYRFGQETDAGATEFTLGMDCRGDHHGGNVRRRRSHVCGADCRSRCRAARSPGLAKLIVKTVQFGPAEPFFQAYAVSIEPMNSLSQRDLLASWKRKNYDPRHQKADTQTA
jgi:hypothetical protein